jgi:hypothetical protein
VSDWLTEANRRLGKETSVIDEAEESAEDALLELLDYCLEEIDRGKGSAHRQMEIQIEERLYLVTLSATALHGQVN